MVLDAGLLNDADGPASILPVVAFIDRQKGTSLRWWQGEPKDEARKFLVQISRTFHEKLQVELSKQGFHMIKPPSMQISPLPEPYRVERPSNSDYAYMSDFFNAPMIMKGDVRFRDSREAPGVAQISVKLQVVQATTGRMVGEVSRQYATEPAAPPGAYETQVRNKLSSELPEISKDLATQVLEAWQRGTLNTNTVRLAVRGGLTPKQLADLKTGLLANVREVKGLRERYFEGNQVLFDVDYAGEANTLTDKLRSLRLPTFETRLAGASEQGLSLDVRAR
jgi:hypothetical protein